MLRIVAETIPLGAFQPADAELFIKWMWKQKDDTCFDPKVIAAPRVCMLKASSGDHPIAFVPYHPVIAIESLCIDENASQNEVALALYEIHRLVRKILADSGHIEAYFTTRNERFANLAEGRGWKKHLFDQEKHTWLMKLEVSAPTAEKTDASS